MYCAKCGAANSDKAKYCLRCGAELLRLEKPAGGKPVPAARAAGAPAPASALARPAAPRLPRWRRSSSRLNPDRNTDWRAWLRQVVGWQGGLVVLFALLAGALHLAEPYLLAAPPAPALADPAQRQVIEALLAARPEAWPPEGAPRGLDAAALEAGAWDLDGQPVRLEGTLAQFARDDYGNYFLQIAGPKTPVGAVYTGYLGNLYRGETVAVEGLWNASRRAVSATSARTLSPRAALRGDETTQRLATQVVYGVDGLLLLLGLAVFLGRGLGTARRRARVLAGRAAAPLATLLVCLFLVAGCDMEQSVTVNPDGSGRLVTTFRVDAGQMGQLRSAPNMVPFLTGLQDDLESKGATVQDYVAGNTEYIVVERPFASLDELTSWEGSLGVSIARSPTDAVFTYTAELDAAALYPDPNTPNAGQIAGQLDAMKWLHKVTLPGRQVASSPASTGATPRGEGTETTWTVPPKGGLSIRYVSQFVDRDALRQWEDYQKAAAAHEGLLLASLQYASAGAGLLLLLALVLFRPAARREVAQ
ncbi:MAG: zinc ribbon domain-containing protein [Actinobacteria bacterium]|nr:zinc ribbon domain-containing protein [Actinomycetota bacterium]